MDDTQTLDLFTPDNGDEAAPIEQHASHAYLGYAVSTVKSRALPEIADGLKPVQRRILYAMGEASAGGFAKCARYVGEVLGKYHPHGDSSTYEALVHLAQPFSMRYPLIDGQGNFGSRDGDAAAAYRYTEARLSRFAELMLAEIGEGTVDFVKNYDGKFEEPALLPARLPFGLLNGSFGIPVGFSTRIPSHNLKEVAEAAAHVIKHARAKLDDVLEILPGPDFPGGGQLISPAEEIRQAYETGRGSLLLRCKWERENLARGQWRIVVTELPHGVSVRQVMEEIEALANPKPGFGKKEVTQEQKRLTQFRLDRVEERLHIIEGRIKAYAKIDEVIKIIRAAEDPAEAKEKLRERFKFSERQAEDIVNLRLGQLTRLDGIKMNDERKALEAERKELKTLLGDEKELKKLVTRELAEDARKYGDERRTLIKPAERAQVERTVVEEPLTVILSRKGWMRARTGHGLDVSTLTFKEGDALAQTLECKTTDAVIVLAGSGKTFTIAAADIPSGRGDLESKTRQGKDFFAVSEGAQARAPARVGEGKYIAALSSDARLLLFDIGEIPERPNGGVGVQLLALPDGVTLADVAVTDGKSLAVSGIKRKNRAVETLDAKQLAEHMGKRAQRGKLADVGFRPDRLGE